MNATYPGLYFPPNVDMVLHGHTHIFEGIDFTSQSFPATFVTGNAGTALDIALPNPFDTTVQPAPGATVSNIADSAGFGLLLMQYEAGAWVVTEYALDGTVRTTCTSQINGQTSCDNWGYLP